MVDDFDELNFRNNHFINFAAADSLNLAGWFDIYFKNKYPMNLLSNYNNHYAIELVELK